MNYQLHDTCFNALTNQCNLLLSPPFCSGPLAGLSLVPELAAAAAPKPVGEVGSSTPRRSTKADSGASSEAKAQAKPPQPTDLMVPAGVEVVAVTGPNTGV